MIVPLMTVQEIHKEVYEDIKNLFTRLPVRSRFASGE
jgi:hypothetical protein